MTISLFHSLSCKKDKDETVIDIDGNVYHTVKIGDQVWMSENLRVTKYRDGTAIPDIADNTQWSNANTGAACYYNNDLVNLQTYGRLYNYFAVHSSKQLAPEGWHIPSESEINILLLYLKQDGSSIGGNLKEVGYTHWNEPNTNATNKNGFTALPGGLRTNMGIFTELATRGVWYSSNELSSTNFTWGFYVRYNSGDYNATAPIPQTGLSVRCIKD